MNTAIIGAGIGGLSAGCLLAARGHQVTIYEKNSSAGGKMNQVCTGEFRFDTGPSLLTMPELLRELFTACGKNFDDYLTLEPLSPLCRYFFKDGTRFDNYEDLDQTLQEIERIAPQDTQAYIDFLEYAADLYDKTASAFLYNPLFDFSDLKDLNFADLLGIDALRTVSGRVDDFFESPYLRQFFKRFTTYNGSSPFQAPATLNVIPHVEVARGGYYVKGGIYKIAEALTELAESLGVTIRLNSEVMNIKTEHGAVSALELANGDVEDCDIVVSNSDAFETYLRLLPSREVSPLKQRVIASTEPSCSGFVLLLGINRKYDQLRHHNVFFSENYQQEFRTIFQQKQPAADPTIYIANTSYSDPTHAIEGGTNLFILVNAPYLTEELDWTTEAESYSSLIKDELENRGLKGLQESIVFEKSITPLDFYQHYRSNRGSIYGTSSNSRMAAFLRPANKARNVEGLYLTGGSTHPGGGIPLVILSAMHACALIERYEI